MQNNELIKIYWDDIIDSPLFTAIPHEHIEDMIDYLDGSIKKYKKNETIIHVGDEFRRCGILLDGSLEVSYNTNRFEKHNVNHFNPGQIFGESCRSRNTFFSNLVS